MGLDQVTIAIATYGDEEWRTLAQRRPIPCVESLGYRYVYVHEGAGVHEARNAALDLVGTEWVIHLDGDDELAPGYVEAMLTGSADVRAASVLYHRGALTRGPMMPRVPFHLHDRCEGRCLVAGDPAAPDSPAGNWLVVGAMLRTDLARKVRWRDWPVYEDFDFWQRCYLAGGSFEAIPEAQYWAWSRRGGRNTQMPLLERNGIHHQICQANGVELSR